MLAKKCDRCGKLYEHYPVGSKSRYNAVKRLHISANGFVISEDGSRDLCPECMEAFDEFMTKIIAE